MRGTPIIHDSVLYMFVRVVIMNVIQNVEYDDLCYNILNTKGLNTKE